MRQCVEKGLVSGRLSVTDSTHVKANASRASEQEIDVQEESGNYWERLDAYEEEGLDELKRQTGKRRVKRTKQVKKDRRRSRKKVSRTDPEAGYMKRLGKPNGFYYLSPQTTDSDHGIITAVTVTPGDVHDSRPYLEQLEYIHKNVVPLKAAAAYSAYDFPLAIGCWRNLALTFLSCPSPPMTAQKLNLSGIYSPMRNSGMYICVQMGKICSENGCIAAGAGCSGIRGGQESLQQLSFTAKVFE